MAAVRTELPWIWTPWAKREFPTLRFEISGHNICAAVQGRIRQKESEPMASAAISYIVRQIVYIRLRRTRPTML